MNLNAFDVIKIHATVVIHWHPFFIENPIDGKRYFVIYPLVCVSSLYDNFKSIKIRNANA